MDLAKEKCDCGKDAVYWYAPGSKNYRNPHYCSDCVPRGCECNHNSTLEEFENKPEGAENIDWKWVNENTWTYIDEFGRELPCCEYFFSPDGWDSTNE